MKTDAVPISVNDWVYSHSPGIWRVYRMIHGLKKLRYGVQERQKADRRRLVFSKRLIDEAWKPAFSNEVAGADVVRLLSKDDEQRLAEWITMNPDVMKRFEAIQPAPIDLRVNLSLNLPSSIAKENVEHLIREVFSDIRDTGLTNDAILERIAETELARFAPKMMSNATLQFICKDYELRDNEYVFREVQLVMV